MTTLNTTGLKGSSRTRPWVLNGRGELVLSDAENLSTLSNRHLDGSPPVKLGPAFDATQLGPAFDAPQKTRDQHASDRMLADLVQDPAVVPAVSQPSTTAAVPNSRAGGARSMLLGRHAIGGPTFIEWRPPTGGDSSEGLTFIEQHAAALAAPLARAAALRKARQRTNMMHPYRQRGSTANAENVAPQADYQLRHRRSLNQ
ncbi:hypothetical protein C8F04DRAFT_1267517 [Mycena alexandri]|uniref:Uncharacterized protein n=1 Tax=Mycena alexandri TaxID=1745969 RepID=A0AAD6WZP6_9AGAR|nr:hypothetical protein C8F04DRAFT_1267517 [Mycena alexandri]